MAIRPFFGALEPSSHSTNAQLPLPRDGWPLASSKKCNKEKIFVTLFSPRSRCHNSAPVHAELSTRHNH